jgi:hypothetical protein
MAKRATKDVANHTMGALGITPEDFAPFSEDELRDLARRVETAPAEILKNLIEQSRVGAALLPRFGSVEEVVRPLIAVWGGDDEDFAAAA